MSTENQDISSFIVGYGDASLNQYCDNHRIRRLQMLYNIPPPRYNPISPYPKYTQHQLDMRRKAEILKYTPNNQNSKSNGFTKAHRWSNIVNTRSNTQSNTISPTVASCIEKLDMIPTPTYCSDIPGPVQYLVRDTSIPLYNFNKNTNAYGIITVENVVKWKLIADSDIYLKNGTQTRLFRIFIQDKIDNSKYSFKYSTPIAFYATGNNTNRLNTGQHDCSLNITDIKVAVTYSGSNVNLATNTTYDLSNVTYKCGTPDYNFYFYLGMLTINIPDLYTEPGFIYDVNVSVNINTYSLGSYYNINNVGIFANLQTANIRQSINASTTDIPSNKFIAYNLIGS